MFSIIDDHAIDKHGNSPVIDDFLYQTHLVNCSRISLSQIQDLCEPNIKTKEKEKLVDPKTCFYDSWEYCCSACSRVAQLSPELRKLRSDRNNSG